MLIIRHRDFFPHCHDMVRALFGGPPVSNPTKSTHVKIFLFGAFFASNIVWAGYRGSLTSKLVIQRLKLPFNSIEEFLESDYE